MVAGVRVSLSAHGGLKGDRETFVLFKDSVAECYLMLAAAKMEWCVCSISIASSINRP